MKDLLKDKNILIMGVANKWSIAWGIAEQCRAAGAKLAFSYYGESSLRSLEKLTEGMEDVLLVECDVTKDDEIEKTFGVIREKMGVLHGIAHCIAHGKADELKGGFLNTTREGHALAQDISVYSLIAAAKYARPLMSEGGSIVTLTYYGGEKVVLNYNMMGVAKAALDMSVRYIAYDLAPENIRVNAISAGPIRTLAAKGISDFNKLLKAFEEKAPMKRLVETDEVGKTSVYLFSDLSSGVTGEVIHVDCGYHILGF